MTINVSDRVAEASLLRIAVALESINTTLQKITVPEDYSTEDAAVKQMTVDAQHATQDVVDATHEIPLRISPQQ